MTLPDGGWEQVGVASQGRGTADRGYPTVYTRTSSIYDWICEHIGGGLPPLAWVSGLDALGRFGKASVRPALGVRPRIQQPVWARRIGEVQPAHESFDALNAHLMVSLELHRSLRMRASLAPDRATLGQQTLAAQCQWEKPGIAGVRGYSPPLAWRTPAPKALRTRAWKE